jgi:predicted dinucleotide-binding enzyme
MAHVSILGTGNMGPAIAGVVTKGGNTVELFNQGDADKPVTGEVVVLAVPHSALADLLAQRGRSSPARSSSTSPTR